MKGEQIGMDRKEYLRKKKESNFPNRVRNLLKTSLNYKRK